MDPELLFGPSPAAARLSSQIDRVASTPRTTVLLLGERGCELELAARTIHARSAAGRASGPFLSFTCASLEDRVAALESTKGGTLFLEEVADLGPAQQTALLEALENRAGREGGDQDARLVASTALDLEAAVERGRFREDLFYRLNVLTVRVPPLRERVEDLESLCERLLGRLRATLGVPFRLAQGSSRCLRAHAWPGGLLELEAVLGCAALACAPGDTIEVEHLRGPLRAKGGGSGDSIPADALVPVPPLASSRSLREVEEATIRRVLIEEGGNRSRAARTLGINRTTLYNKLRQYGIA